MNRWAIVIRPLARTVNHVPGLFCKRCYRFVPSFLPPLLGEGGVGVLARLVPLPYPSPNGRGGNLLMRMYRNYFFHTIE
jgi:hypothetical protein